MDIEFTEDNIKDAFLTIQELLIIFNKLRISNLHLENKVYNFEYLLSSVILHL